MPDGYTMRNYREVTIEEEDFAQRERIKCLKLNYTLKCNFKKLRIFLQRRNLRGGDTVASKTRYA